MIAVAKADVPSVSGIYVATPVSTIMVPVTRDSRYTTTCARVNSANVKVGKANNLAGRHRNYIADFGANNILFMPLAALVETQRAETAILRKLSAVRMRSPKGGRMDWLEGIETRAVIATVFEALDAAHISYRRLWMLES